MVIRIPGNGCHVYHARTEVTTPRLKTASLCLNMEPKPTKPMVPLLNLDFNANEESLRLSVQNPTCKVWMSRSQIDLSSHSYHTSDQDADHLSGTLIRHLYPQPSVLSLGQHYTLTIFQLPLIYLAYLWWPHTAGSQPARDTCDPLLTEFQSHPSYPHSCLACDNEELVHWG